MAIPPRPLPPTRDLRLPRKSKKKSVSTSMSVSKDKEEDKFPPLTPPNVSVEAIKRSLMYTPSPRRFKKLRMRRLMERAGREGRMQQQDDGEKEHMWIHVPVGDDGLDRAEGGDAVDESEGAGQVRTLEDAELDELDLAVLNIGLDDGYEPHRNKPTFETPHRDPQDTYQALGEQDDPSGEVFKIVSKKQKSKAKRKQPRRLPVDELVLAPHRVAELKPPEDEHETKELSQDPISQLSSDYGCPRYHRPVSRRPVKPKVVRKGFGDIDISEFRIPKPQNLRPLLPNRCLQAADYADGFEGDEGNPIGRIMPVSHKVRRPSMFLAAKLKGELQFVAYKDFDVQHNDHCGSRREPSHQLEHLESTSLSESTKWNHGDKMSPDPFVDNNCPMDLAEQDIELSDGPSIISDIQTTRTISSPLLRKQLQTQKVRFQIMDDEGEDPSLIMDLPLKGAKDFAIDDLCSPKGESDAFSWQITDTKHIDDDFNTLQDLALISIQKGMDSSDSDESSDDESCSGSYGHIQADADSRQKYPEMCLDQDSADSGDIEMRYEVSPQSTQPEGGHTDCDEIEDELDEPSSYTPKALESYKDADLDRNTSQDAKRFYRLQKSHPTGVAMGVDDIICSPEISRAISSASDTHDYYARRLSSIANQALRLNNMPAEDIHCDQGSIELGDSQKLRYTPEIPETQLHNSQEDDSQYKVLPEDNYFTRASQSLSASFSSTCLAPMVSTIST